MRTESRAQDSSSVSTFIVLCRAALFPRRHISADYTEHIVVRADDFCSGRNNTKATPRTHSKTRPSLVRVVPTYLSTSCARRVTI